MSDENEPRRRSQPGAPHPRSREAQRALRDVEDVRYMAVCGHRHKSAEAAVRCDDRKVMRADKRVFDKLEPVNDEGEENSDG